MPTFDLAPNQQSVADFLKWQRDGLLDLKPEFQRRSVWKLGAKSYLLDTIIRGLPVPLVYLRAQIDVRSLDVLRGVVDGQQRIRTVMSFVDPDCLSDYDDERDGFTIKRAHKKELAGLAFHDLPRDVREQILGYKFSVVTLPPEMEDRDVLQVFARLNSTGLKLNYQELRNADYFGEFKSAMYELAYEQLDRWQGWRVFRADEIARMKEVEFTSDAVLNMKRGLSAKTKGSLDAIYKANDADFPGRAVIERRFRTTMDSIDDVFGTQVADSIFNREMHFSTLFSYVYDKQFGLGSPLRPAKPARLRANLAARLRVVNARYEADDIPLAVEKAIAGAATDVAKRRARLRFLQEVCG